MRKLFLLLVVVFIGNLLLAKTGGGYYIITKKGDTLWKIAKKHYGFASNTIYQAIKAANEDVIKSINYIRPGSKIYLPTKEEINKFSLLLLEEKKQQQRKKHSSSKKRIVKAVKTKKVNSKIDDDIISKVIKATSTHKTKTKLTLPKGSVSSAALEPKLVLPKKSVSGR